ncbi:hypothetical protein ACRHK7_01275 [Weissella tructae]|uniref:hypothetical protein n=1 Tax=Weissella tructae TaxID=887702 RepID=UPI003D9416B0
MKQEYAVYGKDDVLVFTGSAIEAAQYVGLKTVKSLHSAVSRQLHGKVKYTRTGYQVVSIGELQEG